MPRFRQGGAAGTHALRFTPFLLFLLLFAAELTAHVTLLRLPYYWDEAGYYIPAAYDFLRSGTPIPFSTLSNAHPPGLSLLLAGAWKLFGFSPLTTRLSMALAASLALAAVWQMMWELLASRAAAWSVVVLTAVYPVWFAQSTLAHADLPAAAGTLWGLCLLWRRAAVQGGGQGEGQGGSQGGSQRASRVGNEGLWQASVCFTLAALTKEIAICTPLALAALEAWRLRTGEGSLRRVAALCAPALPLAAWFGYHRLRTGFLFGNAGYLRYNATGTLTPARILLALGHRTLHLTAHLHLFVPVLLALGCLPLPLLPERTSLPGHVRREIVLVIVANGIVFSLLGGALLCRYLLPMYPLVLLLAVAAVYRRFGHWLWFPAVGVLAFVAALVFPPPYQIAPEDTLAYSDAIALEQQAIDLVSREYPHGTVLSAWPVTDGLRKPELGYVRQPVPVFSVDNFSLATMRAYLLAPQSIATAIVFSTKYEQAGRQTVLGRWNQQQDERYFQAHTDLGPAAVATLLGGEVVWQAHRQGQWIAVVRVSRPQLARAFGPVYSSYNRQ